MLEKHEQQYTASANVRKITKSAATPMNHRSNQSKSGQHGRNRYQNGYNTPFSNALPNEGIGNTSQCHSHSTVGQKYSGARKLCFKCKSPSHWAKDCTNFQREAPGRAKPSSTTLMIVPVSSPEQMTDEQLEQMLTKRRLDKEQESLKDAAHVDVVQAKDCMSRAVGPILSHSED